MALAEGGVLLDRYEVISKLGQGGSGIVYEALDRSSGERIALKELRRVNPQTLAQFKQEFRVVQEIHHSNLVRLDALFEEQGSWLIAMELVAGKDLLSHLYVDDYDRYFDETELRALFGQLAAGLSALHAAGVVHRDLKPANVRVTAHGRVVLLDFGLATTIDRHARGSRSSGFGTIAYMSPEQADNATLSPGTDWYAFGVCLYEALTGVLPIDAETPGALLAAKRRPHARPARCEAPGVPEDLDELCERLLAVDWHARPGAREVRDVLSKGVRYPSQRPAFRHSSFEGRERELGVLERAWSQAQSGTVQVVILEGESGIGKSALVDHFLAQAKQPLILRSRCYENEQLAYKAFDSGMEELAHALSLLSSSECQALLPPRAALLCRLFPALQSVRALAETPLTGLAADPSVQRIEAFSIFARLLARLSERAPIVVAIDDLQWADADSFRVLEALLEVTRARCLVLATVRPRVELEGDGEIGVTALRGMSCTRELRLDGLPSPSAIALTRTLLGSGASSERTDIIVRESAGHPLFITVLARFMANGHAGDTMELTLDRAITAQIDDLSSKTRSLLETVAVAGSPLSAVLCGQAADLPEADVSGIVAELCHQRLLCRRRAGEVACFHDRIRRVAAAGLTAVQAKALHGRLASTLAGQRKVDAAQLARHYEAAGQLGHALAAYRHSAEQAMNSLAFTKAAWLYARAQEIALRASPTDGERLALHVSHGHALARSGRAREAAKQYRAAASIASGEQHLRLRLLEAEHLLQSACIVEGKLAARSLLAELGVAMPNGDRATIARMAWDRAWLGLGLGSRAEGALLDVRTRIQLDALWGLAQPLMWVDGLTSMGLNTRHLRLARAVVDRTHLALALANEAFTRATRSPEHADVDDLMARARMLAEGSGDPTLEVTMLFQEGAVAALRWNVGYAYERLAHAHRVCIERCLDQPWLLTNVRLCVLPLHVFMAEHARHAASCAAWLAEARARDDRFALSLLEINGLGVLRYLMADDPDTARAAIDVALEPWPREPFSYAHFGELIAVALAELYRGGASGYAWFRRQRTRLANAMMLKVPYGRTTWLGWEAIAILAAHRVASPGEREQLLREVRVQLRALRSFGLKLANLTAAGIEAQLAVLEGDLGRGRALVAETRGEAERCDSMLMAHSLAYLEGVLEPERTGAPRRRAVLEFFSSQGWKDPRRAVAILCPAIDALEHARAEPREHRALTTA